MLFYKSILYYMLACFVYIFLLVDIKRRHISRWSSFAIALCQKSLRKFILSEKSERITGNTISACWNRERALSWGPFHLCYWLAV